MSTPAVRFLTERGIPFELRTYDHDPRNTAYGLEAAMKMQVDPELVFKTIIFLLDAKHPVAAIVPVTATVDTKSLARALGVKRVDDCPVSSAERLTGYVAGGISPFGQKTAPRTVVDSSAENLAHMFVSGGRRGLEIRIAPTNLIEVTDAKTAPIATSSARA